MSRPADRSTIGEKARRFIQKGMLGLVDQRTTQSGRKSHTFPEPVAAYILYLKQLYPPIHDREIVRIVERKFGYHTNHHTVKHFLMRYAIPVQLPLGWTVFHTFEDAYRRTISKPGRRSRKLSLVFLVTTVRARLTTQYHPPGGRAWTESGGHYSRRRIHLGREQNCLGRL